MTATKPKECTTMQQNETLSEREAIPRHETVIAALLQCSTIEAAARVAGCSRTTIWRVMQDEDFKSAYRAARIQIVSDAVARVAGVTGAAVDTLKDILSMPVYPPAVRLAAARMVFDMALQQRKFDRGEELVAEYQRENSRWNR